MTSEQLFVNLHTVTLTNSKEHINPVIAVNEKKEATQLGLSHRQTSTVCIYFINKQYFKHIQPVNFSFVWSSIKDIENCI